MPNERPDLDGWWVATRAELGGLPLPSVALSDLTLRLRRGTFRFGSDFKAPAGTRRFLASYRRVGRAVAP